jgi:hypothetical protein
VTPTGPTEAPNYKANAVESQMRSVENLFSWGQSSLFQKMDPTQVAAGRVSTSEYFGVFPIQHSIAFFQGIAGTSTLLTLGVPSQSASGSGNSPPANEVEIFGTLEKVGDPSRSYQFSSRRKLSDAAPIQVISGAEHRLYEVRGVVPREYRVEFGARLGDRVGWGETVVFR